MKKKTWRNIVHVHFHQVHRIESIATFCLPSLLFFCIQPCKRKKRKKNFVLLKLEEDDPTHVGTDKHDVTSFSENLKDRIDEDRESLEDKIDIGNDKHVKASYQNIP